MSAYNDTSEKYLVRICRKVKAVGISATALLNTVIGNYEINYLRQTLRDGFHTISAVVSEKIRTEYDRKLNISKTTKKNKKCIMEIWKKN